MRRTGPSKDTRYAVVTRSRGRCERCGRGGDFWLGQDIHHRKPRRMGGTRDPEINSTANLVLLCRACHDDVESHRTQGAKDGWILSARQEPSMVPVNLNAFGPTLLTKDGGYIVTEDENG